MGTDKRQRQKEGRQARIAAAEAARHREEQRSTLLRLGAVVVVVVALIAGFVLLRGDDDETETATGDTTTTSFDPLASMPAMESAAGKPCVAPAEPPAEGEPTVPVKEGDPPAELVVEDLEVGDGEEVPDDPAVTVEVNYVGVACSTGVKFDSSFERGESISFPLNGVIPGWTQGIPGMKVGGTRLLGIPGDLAYGPQGAPPDIAPDETLWFVVELVGIGEPAPTEVPGAVPGETTIPAGSETTIPAGSDASTTTTG